MSSTYKTSCLGLNKFIGTDKPKMDDFNFDNEKIDAKFQEHMQSELHITDEERQLLKNADYTIGTYTGDDTSSRNIDVGFDVEFGLVFAQGEPIIQAASGNITNIYSGIITQTGSSKGVIVQPNGFKVTQLNTTPPDGKKMMLNQSGKVYIYIVFPKKN